MEPRLNLTKP